MISKGFTEIFTENLSMSEKVLLFSEATDIIGLCSGGLTNLLFATKKCNVISIVSPTFLDINNRFRYSIEHTNITYFFDTYLHYEKLFKITKYTRVLVKDINLVGEVVDYEEDNNYIVKVFNEGLTGFSSSCECKTVLVHESNLEPLDHGLNSPFFCKLDNFI